MAALCRLLFLVIFTFLTLMLCHVNGGIPGKTQRLINKANKNGPYLGLVIPNLFEMNPLLQHPSYKPSNLTIDVAGRRFRFGAIAEEKVILVMTGLAMGLELENCINSTTCLSSPPKVARVSRGASASIYLDNAAYRSFLYNKFRVSPVEMESAAVALICYQQRVPFITFRALSDLAGGGSAESNEADTFTPLAANNSVAVVVEFIKMLGTLNSKPFSS
ncbi:hypothetical protein Pfo_010745 [Paulownia fortunei]|nr:hypothetical protein Pfo_010745 [Paulownia fortunei]